MQGLGWDLGAVLCLGSWDLAPGTVFLFLGYRMCFLEKGCVKAAQLRPCL